MRLKFCGANRQVTGSCYLLEAAGMQIVIDCGLYQERDMLKRNWADLPFELSEVDAVLLTHGHLDHCGRVPILVRDGYKGKVYGTEVTCDLAEIVMMDSGRIHEEDAKYKAKRHKREKRKGKYPEVPLYTADDAKRALPRLCGVDNGGILELGKGVRVVFHESGHILGGSILEVVVDECNGEGEKRVIFSGDVGQWDKPLVPDPELLERGDYVVIESTYGDRNHSDKGNVEEKLAEAINEAYEDGGNVLIPTFAIERAQELLFHLSRLRDRKAIPAVPVFLDSPMAVKVTEVFGANPDFMDDQTRGMIARGHDPMDFYGLQLCRSVAQSKAINAIRGTAIIMAGSGMCTGGRIKHHLVQNISRAQSTILFVGYQALGTMGRHLLSEPRDVRIHGKKHRVFAKIRQIYGFSAHADHDDLLRWMGAFDGDVEKVFVTHGEEEASMRLADEIGRARECEVMVPEYCDVVELA